MRGAQGLRSEAYFSYAATTNAEAHPAFAGFTPQMRSPAHAGGARVPFRVFQRHT